MICRAEITYCNDCSPGIFRRTPSTAKTGPFSTQAVARANLPPVPSLSRLALASKRLDRWREMPRCFREFDHPSALAAAYLGVNTMAMPTVVQHRSGLRLQVNE